VQITIPELEPVLDVARGSDGSEARLTISGRVQSPDGQSIAVRADGEELLLSHEPLVQVSVPRGSEVTVELLDGERVIAVEELTIEGSGGDFPVALVVAGMAAMLAAASAMAYRRKRALDPSSAVSRALQPAPAEWATPPIAPAILAGELKTSVIVSDPDGRTRRIVVRRDAALTIGTSPTCDIRLADEGVRAVHGTLTACNDGQFELQPVGVEASGETGAAQPGGLRVRPGEPVRIGRHVLVIE
jgi:hypothetical protein